jgi:Lar family restriction alleviation protein
MSDGDMVELKPCPFCGGTGGLQHQSFNEWDGYAVDSWIQCSMCGSCGAVKRYQPYPQNRHASEFDTPQGAVNAAGEAWNRRAALNTGETE